MNKKFQSQALAAILVLASSAASLQPTFAASTSAKAPASATTLKASSVDNKALWNQVKSLLTAGNFDEALKVIDQAIKQDSKNAPAYVMKAVVMLNAKQSSELVLAQLNTALSIAPDYSDALFLRGIVYEDMEDLDSAGKDFDACIALDSHDLQAINESLNVKCRQQDWNGMLSVLQIQFANNEVDGNAYFARAYAEYKLGQTAAAVADFKQAQSMFIAANDAQDAQTASDFLNKIQNG